MCSCCYLYWCCHCCGTILTCFFRLSSGERSACMPICCRQPFCSAARCVLRLTAAFFSSKLIGASYNRPCRQCLHVSKYIHGGHLWWVLIVQRMWQKWVAFDYCTMPVPWCTRSISSFFVNWGKKNSSDIENSFESQSCIFASQAQAACDAIPGTCFVVNLWPEAGGRRNNKTRQCSNTPRLFYQLSLHRASSFGIRSGRHAHASGSSSASCCCNGFAGLNWNTCIWYVEVWELKLYFYRSAGGFKKRKKNAITLTRNIPTVCTSILNRNGYYEVPDI